MPLVDYGSDSDSDSAPAPPTPAPPPKLSNSLSALLPKPKTRGPLPSASSAPAPRKIIVQLPKSAEDPDSNNNDGDEPPSKRARMSGATPGGGFAAMLPAPKRSGGGGKAAGGGGEGGEGKKVARVLGGAAARKEDENLVVPMERGVFPGDYDGDGDVDGKKGEVMVKAVEVEKVITAAAGRKPIMPMSFYKRKGAGVGAGKVGGGSGGSVNSVANLAARPVEKVSLFGAAPVFGAAPAQSARDPKEYKPLLVTSIAPTPVEEEEEQAARDEVAEGQEGYGGGYTTYGYNSNSNQPPPDELEKMARDAGLDDAALRQLRGRGNRRGGPIKIVDFNVEAEYNENEHARLMGLAEPAINPVRSIAPGKHQLTSLLNAAQAQKGALEEHFAQGKRNKKEAGSKYGW